MSSGKKILTVSQFTELRDQMRRGYWAEAAEQAVEYGFYATDLLHLCMTAAAREGHDSTQKINDLRKMVILAEMSTKQRKEADAHNHK